MSCKSWELHSPTFDYEASYPDYNEPWSGHKLFAYDLIANVKPKNIVELGTYKGTSFFAFCQAVKDLNLATKLNAVDTWQGDPHAGFYKEDIYEKFIFIKESYYNNQNLNIIRERFDEAVNQFRDNSIELLHIDGYHTYEAVKHDFDTWFPKLSADGILLFHDTAEERGDFGVYKLWDELCKRYANHITFLHSHGLGIIFLGNAVKYYNLLLERVLKFDDYYKLASFMEKNAGQRIKKESETIEHYGELQSITASLISKNKDLENVVRRQKDQINKDKKKFEDIRNSLTWRLGRLILTPFIFLRLSKTVFQFNISHAFEALLANLTRAFCPVEYTGPKLVDRIVPANKNVIYTVILGDYDHLKEPESKAVGWDYICFTDRSDLKSNIWTIVRVKCPPGLNHKRCNGYFKTIPFRYLQEYDLSLLIDGSVSIHCDLNDFIEKSLPPGLSMATLKNPHRDCIYEAAEKVKELKKDLPVIVDKQMQKYRNDGFPEHFGLVWAALIIRRHNDKNLRRHSLLWLKEIISHSQRDQLSFNYILWKYRLIDPVLLEPEILHSDFKIHPHNYRQIFE
ncbi:MAG: class I SAM-dependent methyltransferase [Bacteroidales bacterium]